MAKKKKAKRPVNYLHRISEWMDLHRFKAAAVIVIIAVAGWWIVTSIDNQLKIVHERQQFSQAKLDLDIIYEEIATSVGVPYLHNDSQSCRYTSTEFGTGALSCDVDQFMFYKSPDNASANEKAKRIANVIGANKKVNYSRLTNQYFGGQHLSLDFRTENFPNCGAEFRYLINEPKDLPGFLFAQGGGLSIDINCSKSARAEYYPIEKL